MPFRRSRGSAVTPPSGATRTSPAEPVDLILHVGSGKTGTTSLQFFLRDNREALLRYGLLYPRTPGRDRHTRISQFTRSDDELTRSVAWARGGPREPEEFRRRLRRRLDREIAETGAPRVLLSDEALFSRPRRALARLRELTDPIARSVRVVVYLRRQDELLVSRYQQTVKTGETHRLLDFVDLPHGTARDHLARMRNWEKAFGPDLLVARRFESSAFVGGSLYTDFFDAIGLEADLDDFAPPTRRNDSLDADSVEFLRLLNLHRVEHEGATRRVIDNTPFIGRLTEHSTGPVLSLPETVLDAYMARWEEGNRRVARRYLRDPSGVLFREPRKRQDAVTRQLLDPARIDEYVDLLELPEEWRAPLRAIAEREARAVPSG